MPAEQKQEIIAKAKAKALGIVDRGLALVADEFAWNPNESQDAAADRLLGDLVTALQS